MTLDFTLRDVALRPADAECPSPCDLTFRRGRLTGKRLLPEERRPRLFAVPGFWDAHMHMLHFGLSRQRLDLGAAQSLEEALAALEAYARAHPEKAVLWGEGWDESAWAAARLPERADLDRVVPDRPVVLRRVCGHLAVLNSRAAAQAASRWPDLDPRGVLTGERAMALASIWPPTPAERETALLDAQAEALRLGIVRVSEMGSEGAVDAYLGLLKRGTLRGEVLLYFRPAQLDLALRLRDEGWLERENLRLGGIKVFTDGSIGARTAALREPYADGAGRGRLLCSDEQLAEILDRCVTHQVPVAVHAIGDAALAQVVQQAEGTLARRGPQASGWVSLEHAELVDEGLIERAGAARLRFSMQPNFIARWGGPGALYERALGAQRWARHNPLRRIWDAGVPLVFGSDGMPMDPVGGLRGAVEHPVAAARLTPDEALSAYSGWRASGVREWEPDASWRLGCDGLAIFERDPLDPGAGGAGPAPVRALLWRQQWILAPSDDLRRQGVVHDE